MRVFILGVGNRDRGDDAAGLLVLERLEDRVGPDVTLVPIDQNAFRILDHFEPGARVIVIDATRGEEKPGTIRIWRLETEGPGLPKQGATSTHGFDIGRILELARNLDQLPKELMIIGIEGRNFEIGAPLHPDVEAALPEVVKRVEEIVGEGWGEPASVS